MESRPGDRGMTEDTKPFTVKDRRHWSAAGEDREEPVSEQVATPSPEPRGAESALPAPNEYPRDFGGLLISLAAQAASFLAQQPPALSGAQAFIHLLEILEEKSTGRRAPEEDALLERLLFELRMGFVAVSRSSKA